MESKDKLIFASFFILILVGGYTFINIQKFMKKEITCEDDFAIINKCGCIPVGSNYSFAPKTEESSKSEINFSDNTK